MRDIKILCGVTGVILLSVVCVAKQSLIAEKSAENYVSNRTQLQRDIEDFLSQIEAAENNSKLGDFVLYRKQNLEQYDDLTELITNKEKDFDGFKHLFCQELEANFKKIGNELHKILGGYNEKFEKNRQKFANYKDTLENIERDLNKCNETVDEGCLHEVESRLSVFVNIQVELEGILNIMDENYDSCQADVSSLKIPALGDETRKCLSKLSDIKDKISLYNSSIVDRMNKVNTHFAKVISDSKSFAKTMEQRFVTDLNEQISASKVKFAEYKKNAEDKHLNSSKCISNETEFEEKKQKFSKLFSEIADAFISTIENEISSASVKIEECATNFYQELDELSKCSNETCLNEVEEFSQNKTKFVISNITEVPKAYENVISKLTSDLKRSANDGIGSFSRNINQGVICLMQLEAEKRINDLGIAYKESLNFAVTSLTVYRQNAIQSLNSFNTSYNNNVSLIIENMQEREEIETENNIDISRCPSRSKKEISNNMKKFSRKMIEIESQTINYFNETEKMISDLSHLTETFVEKLNLCLDESCMNDTVASYKKQSQSNLNITEEKNNAIPNYVEKIKSDLSVLLNDSLKRCATDFNELTTCLSTAEEIHKQGLSLNSSLDVILIDFDEYLKNITIFINETTDTVDADVKSRLFKAVKEIEAKKDEAKNKELDLKSCLKIDNLHDLVSTAMARFNRDMDEEQKDVDKIITESMGKVQNAKSFTRNHLHDLDVCLTEQCMKHLTKNFEKEIKNVISASRAVNDSLNHHISRTEDSVRELAKTYLNKTVTDLDVSKNKVIDCLVAEINSSSVFTPSFVIILSIFIVKFIINM